MGASEKERALNFVNSLPDDSTLDQIIYRLYLEQRIAKAEQQMKDGQFLTQEEVKIRFKKWLE
jgi:hypothetical protein